MSVFSVVMIVFLVVFLLVPIVLCSCLFFLRVFIEGVLDIAEVHREFKSFVSDQKDESR